MPWFCIAEQTQGGVCLTTLVSRRCRGRDENYAVLFLFWPKSGFKLVAVVLVGVSEDRSIWPRASVLPLPAEVQWAGGLSLFLLQQLAGVCVEAGI